MPAAGTLYQPQAPSMPRPVPSKGPIGVRPAYHPMPFRPAGSPPGASASYASSINTSAVPSLTHGSSRHGYAGSTGSEHDSSSTGGATSVDLLGLMTERVGHAVNPLPMDRGIAVQAQT